MEMKQPVIMHVNYCENEDQSLDEICRKAAGWGFDGVEFRRKRMGRNWRVSDEKPEVYLDALEKAVRTSGLKLVLFGAPGCDLMTTDAATRAEELRRGLRFFQLASDRFSLSVCNFMSGHLLNSDKTVPDYQYEKHGSAVATDDQWRWASEGFRQLGDFAAAHHFRLAFETHMNYLHDTPRATQKLVARIDHPAVGINLDYGNALYFPGNPSLLDTIPPLADKLFYVHLKNSILCNGARVAVGLADGEINHHEYLRLLREHNYTGPICIEAPRAGDREWFARTDLAYIQAVIAEVAKQN